MTKNNQFQEYLTESLNSAPYPYELEAKSTSMDRFYIIDAEGQKYRLWFEVRKALGAKVMQVVIGKAETNPKIYKKIIQRFENPMRIFATMMAIFREGVKGGDNYMKAQDGFAIALPEAQFDRFESLLGRVMKRVLTGTQFEEAKGNISFTNEEFFYLPVVRKGKKPEEVFSGKEVVQTSDQTTNGAPAATQAPTPAPKPAPNPVATAAAPAFDEKKADTFLKNNPLGTIINPLPVGKQRELLIQHLKGAKWEKERMGKSINEYFKTTINGKVLTFMPIMSTVNKMNGRLRVPSGTRRKAYIYINYGGNPLPNLEFGVAIGETDSANKAKDANLASMKKFIETLTGMTLGNYGWYSTN